MTNYQTLNIGGKTNKNNSETDSLDDDDFFSDDGDDNSLNLGEDDDDDFDVEILEDSDDSDNNDNTDDDSEDEPADDAADEDEEEAFANSRENDRIRTLNEKAKAEKEKVKVERKRRIELEKQNVKTQKETIETLKSNQTLIGEMLKERLQRATEEGDFAAQADLTDKLMDSKQKLATLNNWEEPTVDESEEDDADDDTSSTTESDNTKNKRAEIKDAPKAAQKWLAKNEWFVNPKTQKEIGRQKEALFYANFLADKKGMDFGDPEYYVLIDKRLEKLGLASKKTDKVNLNNKSSEGRKTNSNSENSNNGKKRQIAQTVRSSSRTVSSSSKRNKVTLTASQLAIADTMGQTPVEYARELLKIENARKNGSRMTSVF